MDKYDLLKEDDQWKLRKQGAERSVKTFDTKEKAKDFSVRYMHEHGGSLRIRKENGRIQEERTYPRSSDPKRSKG